MSEIFTASNGVKVRAGKVAGIHIDCAGGTGAHDLAEDETEALREFFQHERDQELGRWRYPSNPDYVVYGDDSTIVVLMESDGAFWEFPTAEIRKSVGESSVEAIAIAWALAHPERKPWEDAEDGNLWLIRFDDFPETDVSALVKGGRFIYNDHCHEGVAELSDPHITAGRRIWPESS